MARERVWMATAKLRAYARSGRTLEEIRVLNEQDTGWKPSRSAVSKKLSALGEEPRHVTRRELVPWEVTPAHKKDRFYLMLQAESRRRQGNQLSATDSKYVEQLDELLMGRGIPMIVSYCKFIGFYLQPREETDQDIIRVDASCPDQRILAG